MTRNLKYPTVLAAVMGLSTLVMFHQGAEALDLSDFSGADQKVITQDAPKAGGIVLVKERTVQPTQASRVQATVAQPMMRGTRYNAPMMTGASAYNNITPAAGGNVSAGGISSQTDVTLRPGNAFDQAQAKFRGTAASAPVDGKPLTTTTLADGDRAATLNEMAPAAGTPAPSANTVRRAQAHTVSMTTGESVQSMTGRGGSTSFNN